MSCQSELTHLKRTERPFAALKGVSSDEMDSSMNENDITLHRGNSDSEVSQMILSVVWHGNMLGAAYYDTDTCQMHLMKDELETAPVFRLLYILIRQVEPACIILSSRTDERFVNTLESIINSNSNLENRSSWSEKDGPSGKVIHQLPSLDFVYEICKYRLNHLDLPSMPKGLNDAEKQIHMMSLLDFTNSCMIKAAGGLLKFLERRRIGIQFEDMVACPVTSISTFSLENVVTMDVNTFNALQIFQQERHPSMYKNSLGIKEGLSLYGILNRCKSGIGSRRLKQWFLQPTNDLELIQKRQTAVKYFIEIRNLQVMQSLQTYLKNIKFIPTILSHMRTSQATIKDWQALYKTTYNAMMIGDICRSLHSGIEIFQKIDNAFTPDLFRIASLINKIVAFDESIVQNRFIVKPGVDNELDQKKRTYNGLPDFMTKVAQQELQQLSDDIHECSVIYLPQLGYLLAIPETSAMKVTKDYRIENLEFMFISKNVAHYKSSSTRELDSLLGDTLCEITDQETEIMHKLQNVILEISQVLLDVMMYSAELDCLICLAVVAKEFNFVQPEMTTNGSIHITKGRHEHFIITAHYTITRVSSLVEFLSYKNSKGHYVLSQHLLQEMCVSLFMPNDTHSSATDSKIKIITGPNGSGKSVYLKQVGLIVFLAHIGSFVPAEKAQITLVDQIFSRIRSVESISINKSCFFIGLCQMSDTLNHATEKSLVLIDEFGNRTEASAGLFLLSSIIQFWAKQQSACPHIFVSTHFHRLYDCLTHSGILKFQTMEILKTEKEFVYLFKIIDGRAKGSFGNYVALQAGLPNTVLKREKEISKLLAKKGQFPTACNPKASEELYERYEAVQERFLQLDTESSDLKEFFGDINKILQKDMSTISSISNISGQSLHTMKS